MSGFKVGDQVKVGNGKTIWRIEEFWTLVDGGIAAVLVRPDVPWIRSSAHVDRLVSA